MFIFVPECIYKLSNLELSNVRTPSSVRTQSLHPLQGQILTVPSQTLFQLLIFESWIGFVWRQGLQPQMVTEAGLSVLEIKGVGWQLGYWEDEAAVRVKG